MFPWFPFFNRLLQTLSKFNKRVASIAYSDTLNDKQKLAQIKMLLITHEDDLNCDVAKVLESGLFTPSNLPQADTNIVVEEAQGINLIYGLN